MKLTKSLLAVSVLGLTAMAANATQYPDLPVAVKNGAGALIGDTVYVGLGTGGDKFYALNLKEKGAQWQEITAFPGGARSQSTAAAVNCKLYVFGGFMNTEKMNNESINDAYVYDPATNAWTKLMTRSPKGATAGTSAAAEGGKIYFVGGVNQEIWNGLFEDIKGAAGDKDKEKAIYDPYFNLRAQDFFFSPEIASYEPATNTWRNEGLFPFAPRAGAALGIKDGKLIVVNGEIKAGLRTPATELGTVGKEGIKWKKLGDLPAPKGEQSQEGLAAAMGGYSNGYYLVTGGANFPGARANYAKGINDAHRTGGLKKTHHNEVYAFDSKKSTWKQVGELPVNIAAGVAVSYHNEVVLIGGETDSGKALSSVQTLSYDGKKLMVE